LTLRERERLGVGPALPEEPGSERMRERFERERERLGVGPALPEEPGSERMRDRFD
jgi:hypothetical protein